LKSSNDRSLHTTHAAVTMPAHTCAVTHDRNANDCCCCCCCCVDVELCSEIDDVSGGTAGIETLMGDDTISVGLLDTDAVPMLIAGSAAVGSGCCCLRARVAAVSLRTTLSVRYQQDEQQHQQNLATLSTKHQHRHNAPDADNLRARLATATLRRLCAKPDVRSIHVSINTTSRHPCAYHRRRRADRVVIARRVVKVLRIARSPSRLVK
jgi:hypothetical protein